MEHEELKGNQRRLIRLIEGIKDRILVTPPERFDIIRSLYDDLVSAQSNLIKSKEEEIALLKLSLLELSLLENPDTPD